MKIQLYLILSLNLVACRQYFKKSLELDAEWSAWKEENIKTYRCEDEESGRRENWEKNRLFIQEENEKGNLYELKSNKFADLTEEEFLKYFLTSFEFEPGHSVNSSVVEYEGDLPNYVDWRENGLVTPVKDQGACGSCYAFSATGALEAQYKLKYGELVSFSEQQVVDCSDGYGNWRCAGGWMVNVFAYWERFRAELSDDYPYYGQMGHCQYLSERGKINVLAYRTLPRSETELTKALAGVGPVSIAVDATSQSFHFYSSGIYQDTECSSGRPTHAMLVIGYGAWHGVEYWLVKNSWGREWGEEGYMRIAKGDNMCGLLTHASFPIISV